MRTTKAARATIIGGGLVTVGVLLLASSLQSAPTSFAQTRAALTQRFVAALPSAFAPAETIPVTKPKPADAQTQASPAPRKEEVRKLNTVVVTTIAQTSGPINPAPRYPEILRAAEVEGAVVARVSYDSQGDPEGITILTSTHKLLSNAVENALKQWHGPAKTSTQVPFVFVMTNKTAKDLASYPGGMPAGAQVITGAPMSERELADRMAASNAPTPLNENQTYFEFQVEKPVTSQPGNSAPRYPTELRAAGTEGEVLAQFVVDQDGQPDMSTFKVLKTDHDLFTLAVSNALPNMHFNAAQVGGKAVKQLVQMPFQFNLSKP